jgi:hypothetical protein
MILIEDLVPPGEKIHPFITQTKKSEINRVKEGRMAAEELFLQVEGLAKLWRADQLESVALKGNRLLLGVKHGRQMPLFNEHLESPKKRIEIIIGSVETIFRGFFKPLMFFFYFFLD